MTTPISNINATFANTSIRYDAIGMNVNASAYAANSTLINLKTNGNTKFSVDVNGTMNVSNIIASNISATSFTVNNQTVDDIAKSRSIAMALIFG